MIVKVTLRQKKITKGRKSLYLDFYPPIYNPNIKKTTRREFLKLYIIEEPSNRAEKQQNKETLQLAESIRHKRENYLNKPEIYNEYEKERLKAQELGEQCFIAYFKSLAKKKKTSNKANWDATLHYLNNFTENGSISFNQLDKKYFEDFKAYLLTAKSRKSSKTTLSQNTASSYFNKVKVALKQAYIDEILQTDLNAKIKPIKEKEVRKVFLTLKELNVLVKTECETPVIKQSALFSALTGLRVSDILKLTWGELEYIEDQGYFINFNQKKTEGVEVLPISEQAYKLTNGTENPKQMPRDEKVFKGLKYSAHTNKLLKKWIESTGISKKITFHNFRHTYATLQLFNGTDIYTVSKMLGHKNLKNTQVYAKVVDQAKRNAVNKIQLDI